MSQNEEKFEEEFSNWTKSVLGLQKARDGSISYIKRAMEPFVDKLRKKHKFYQSEHFKELLNKVTVKGDVKKIHLHKKDGTKIRWVLDGINCKTCDEIFEEQLDMFIDSWCPCKKWICNSQKEQVEPTSYWWILAKMYIAKPEIIDAVKPEEDEPLAIFNLIKHCKLFDHKLRLVVDVLVQLRHRLMHSANDRLTRKEMDNSFDAIKEFLIQIAANPTETTDIINEVEMLEKRTIILYDENGELNELAKEALQQQNKSLNADLKAPEGTRGSIIKSLAASNLAIKESEKKHNEKIEELVKQHEQHELKLINGIKKRDKKIEELLNTKEDIQRKYEESEKKVHQYEGLYSINDVLVDEKKSDVYKVKSSRDINIKEANDTEICHSSGCCLTHDNQLLVTDKDNMKIKRIDTNTMKIVDSCVVDNIPRGIVCVNNLEAAVACQLPNKIQFVFIENKMKLTRSIITFHDCYGIAMKDDCLYVTDGDTSLYVYDMNGALLRVINRDDDGNELFSRINHIAFNSSGNKMFVCDEHKGLVCFGYRCNYLSTIKDNVLYEVVGVCTDGRENVFVTDYEFNNVVQFSEDGKKIGVVVKQEDGLIMPSSMSFHQGHNRMYVTMINSDIIKMYELE